MSAKIKSILGIVVILLLVLWLASAAFKMAFGLVKIAVIVIVVLIVAAYFSTRRRR